MLKSYFFIPADKEKFIGKMDSIKADEFVFDFEDALAENLYEQALDNVKKAANFTTHFVRPKLFDNSDNLSLGVFEDLLNIGFRKFVLPKVSSTINLKKIENKLESIGFKNSDIQVILLIEDPHGLIYAKELLENSGLQVIGIGLGSHDYSRQIGMTHTLENLGYARAHVLNIAKAFRIEAIDIASMNVSNEQEFDTEIKTGFELGYDSKFIIHPFQLNLLKQYLYYSKEVVDEANEVYSEIEKFEKEDFSVIKVNGKIFEKPHIDRIKKIIKWAESNGSQ